MATITLHVNGKDYHVDPGGEEKLLFVLRDLLGLTGTKYGCAIEACGACTVLLDGEAEKSCDVDVTEAVGRKITTIEGLDGSALGRRLQQAWIDEQVPQCGYCQSGMLLAAASLIRQGGNPSDAEIAGEMRNICACGTYDRVRKAIHRAAQG